MNITDEILMAYADGELDVEKAAAVTNEIEKNPTLAKRVAEHRALRKRLQIAFDPVLEESIPQRLMEKVSKQSAVVTDLSQRKAAQSARSAWLDPLKWMPIAASIAFGILLGFFAFKSNQDVIVAGADGVIAQGNLARALSEELASRPTKNSTVRIGVSYEASSGDYCRTFIATAAHSVAGLACHEKDAARAAWRIRVLVPVDATSDANYRAAADAMPAAVLDQVNKEITGEPFDAEREAQVVSHGWTSH